MFGFARSSIALVALLSAAACSSAPSGGGTGGTPSTGGTPGKGTPGTGTPGEGPQAVIESGTIVDYNTNQPIAGATVTAADQTTKTAADGTFSLTLQKGEAFELRVVDDGYATLLQQQTSLSTDYKAGKITIVPQSLAGMLTAMLPGYDATLGVLSVALVPTGACTTEDGATITVTPAGSAKVTYFSGGLPSRALTAVKGGQFPSAVIYNVDPGVQLSIHVVQAACKEVPFPFTQNGVEYTGGISTNAGQVTGFARVFLN